MPSEYPGWNNAFHGLWKPDLSSSSHILPHTHEAGDSYYIGDIYEPSRIGQSGELIEKNLSHFQPPTPSVSKLALVRVIPG